MGVGFLKMTFLNDLMEMRFRLMRKYNILMYYEFIGDCKNFYISNNVNNGFKHVLTTDSNNVNSIEKELGLLISKKG